VNIPIGLLLLFLTGVGPLLAWRRTSLESLRRNFGWPLLGGVASGTAAFALGFRDFFSLVCLTLCVFVTLTIVMEFYRGARVIRAKAGTGWLPAVAQLTLRNTRRYGGYVVHFGIVLVFIGISGAAFNQDKQMEMPIGSTMELGPFHLVMQSMDSKPEKNYTAERMIVEVMRDGKPVMMLYPEKRFFTGTNEQSGTMVAIYSTLRDDLYVVYAGRSPENNRPVIHAYLNPLVKWIWLGGLVVVLGTVLALVPNRQPVLVLQGARQPTTTGPFAQPVPTTLSAYESHD
jgi:cytochrome c-type biogenesis protein CcmF